MLISMTGYGRGEARSGSLAVAVEVKTVNHRYFEAAIKLPGGLWEMEPALQQSLKAAVRRGRAEVYVQVQSPAAATRVPVVNADLAKRYWQELSAAGRRLGLPGRMDMALIARLPEVVRVEERPLQVKVVGPVVERALQQALKRLGGMRIQEGRRLAKDIRERLARVRALLKHVRQCQQRSLARQEKRLRQKLAQWLQADAAEARRLAQEAVFKHLRADVTEEMVRMDSHLAQCSVFIGRSEAAGRRLDFLLQEMNREVNTIGAKSVDAVQSQKVVMMKEELEKIREQVQNIE
ncbi:YicC family protein [candidate division FCPU426 bacterium]|nr:YicC family protein [candidate division FCPU426 bacterium]